MFTPTELEQFKIMIYDCLEKNERVVIEHKQKKYYLHAIAEWTVTLVERSAVYANTQENFSHHELLEPSHMSLLVLEAERSFPIIYPQLEQAYKVKVKLIEIASSDVDLVEMFLVEEGMPSPSDRTGKMFQFVDGYYQYIS